MTFSMLITVFPMLMPETCGCLLSQGIEDGHRGVSFVRTYSACAGGEIVRRFAQENEQYRAKKWLSVLDPRTVKEKP